MACLHKIIVNHTCTHTLSDIANECTVGVFSALFLTLSLLSMWLGIYYRCLLHCCMLNLLSQNQICYVCKDLNLQLNEYDEKVRAAQNIYSRVDYKETTQLYCL